MNQPDPRSQFQTAFYDELRQRGHVEGQLQVVQRGAGGPRLAELSAAAGEAWQLAASASRPPARMKRCFIAVVLGGGNVV